MLDFYNNDGSNPLNIHPLIQIWLVAFFLKLVEDLIYKRVFFDKVVVLSLFVMATFFVITLLLRGFSGIPMAIHNYLGPITFFLFFYFDKNIMIAKINRYAAILLTFSVILGLYGLVEYMTKGNPLDFLYQRTNLGWVNSTATNGYRIKTTIGHPLLNALYFLFSMIIVQMRVKNVTLKYSLLLLFVTDILLTGSRSMFVLAFFVMLYDTKYLKSEWLRLKQNIIKIAVVFVIICLTFISSLGGTLLARFASANSSTEARFILLKYFINNITSFNMTGLGGATESVILIGGDNNPIILENPWIILFIDMGYFIIPFIFLIFFIARKTVIKYYVFVFIVAVSGFNSFGVKSNVNYILFYLLVYGYILWRQYNGISSELDEKKQIYVKV